MRKTATIIVALGLAAGIIGCGSGGTTRSTPAATTTLSTAQLQARMLTLKDLGSGWQQGQPITPEDLSSVGQAVPCADVPVGPEVAKRLTASTGVQFEPTDHSPRHLIELAITGEPKQLQGDLDALTATMEACSAKTSTTASTSKLTVKSLPIPRLGDQQAAYVMTDTEAPGSPQTWYVRNAVVRVGSVALAFGLTEVLASSQDKPQISDDEFAAMLQTAVNKVRG